MILNIFKSTTDTILTMLIVALIGFTLKGTVDPKDFMGIVLMVASYKFGRNQAKVESIQQLG